MVSFPFLVLPPIPFISKTFDQSLTLSQLCACVRVCRKMPYRLSKTRKFRQRLRLKSVDEVISTLSSTTPASSPPVASLVRASASQLSQSEVS